MAHKPVVYLQLTSLEMFIEELKRRGINEARLTEWVQRREVFERRKLRLTALDSETPLILRFDYPFYQGFVVEHAAEKYQHARREAEQYITSMLKEAGVRLCEGEYHDGRSVW